jgi:hypothetical protein
MRTDPADTGGLFVGRRSGTAATRVNAIPQRVSRLRRRMTGSAAGVLLATMIALSLLCWGPIPLACLWVASAIDYLTGNVLVGIIAGFIALFPLLFGVLLILRQIDQAWILMRRAGGHDQHAGVMVWIFGMTAFVCALAYAFWFEVLHGYVWINGRR